MGTPYRLGIDLGTASVGLAAYLLDEDRNPTRLAYHAVRLFDEPLESGQAGLASKAAVRRQARMQRRQIDRRAGRQVRVSRLARYLEIEPSAVTPRADLPVVRAHAARKRVELDDLLRIFLRMSKKRGYAGEFGDKKKGAVAEGARGLEAELARVAALLDVTKITLGEYLLWRIEHGIPSRLKIRSDAIKQADEGIPNLYALRRHVLEEFEQIWNTQQAYHPILSNFFDGKPLRDIFRETIFHQRPLKSFADKVGRCQLEPTLPRAPRAQPAFQEFRIEKTLADLRWGIGRRAEVLSHQQKKVIRTLLADQEEVSFKKILTELEKEGCSGPAGKGLNLDRLSRDFLPGNKTNSVFRKLGLLQEWKAIGPSSQISTINFLADLGSPEQLDDPEWHTRFSRKDGSPRKFNDQMIAFVDRLRAHDKFDSLVNMGFDGGRAAYSVKALNQLKSWLREPVWPGDWQGDFRTDEEMAAQICYPTALAPTVLQSNELAAPPVTGNAVVDKALRQLRWTLNRAMLELGGPPSEIVIEMAREMGLGVTRRNERESDNRKNQKARRSAADEILAAGMNPTPNRIRRVLLWREQDCQCPYCGQLMCLSDVLSGGSTEYEHILPRKLTQVGMKTSEIVLVHHQCNQRKGARTPWAAAQAGDVTWPAIEQMAEVLRRKRAYRKAKLLVVQDYEDEVLTDESIAAFADRQFHATAWVTKEAARWLEPLCPGRVSTSKGELTALLRRHWKLESVISEVRYAEGYPVLDEEGHPISPQEFAVLRKVLEGHSISELRKEHLNFHFERRPNKRIDNRHHLIDAMVIGLVSRSLFMKMAKDYKFLAEGVALDGSHTQEERERTLKWRVRRQLPIPAPPVADLRKSAVEAAKEHRISRKPDRYPSAAFFDQTAYSVVRADDPATARLVLRESVATLGGTDVKKVTLESARAGIGRIEGSEIRSIISSEFERRLANGAGPAEALKTPISHPVYQSEIRKVRCIQDRSNASEARRIEHQDRAGQKHWKYLLNSGFAWVDIWKDGSGKIRSDLKPIVDAMGAGMSRPPKGVLRLHKGDVVRNREDGILYRICSFKSAGLVLFLPLIEPRSFKEANEKAAKGTKVGGTISFSRAIDRFELVTDSNVRTPSIGDRVGSENFG